MSKRYYCPQFADSKRGWVDLPSLASTKEKEALDNMENFAKDQNIHCVMRVIRKTHGWEPK